MLVYNFLICVFLIGSTFNTPIIIPVEDETNYELLGGEFEGDMILPYGFNPTITNSRGVAINEPRRWPDNIIPYDLSLITNAGHRTMIENAMKTLMDVTSTPIEGTTARIHCITFRPKLPNDKVFLKIQYGTGCSASVGYSAFGQKKMTLQENGCFGSGTIQHELMHVLGFYHEQSRPDRDQYITINYGNIKLTKVHNFVKYNWDSSVINQNTPYDYGSIMHYGGNSFSSNGKPSITPKVENVQIGQRAKLSPIDIAEIRAYYGCSS